MTTKELPASYVGVRMPTLRKLFASTAGRAASLVMSTIAPGASGTESVTERHVATLVWDVLTFEFEPVDQLTRVRLSMRGLRDAWIPTIPNVEFVLLSDADVAESDGACVPYYFFDSLQRTGSRITVEFGCGTPCNSRGHIYAFRSRRGQLEFDGRGIGGFARGASHCRCRSL